MRLGEYLNLYFQNYMSEKDAQEQKLHGKMNYNIEGKHVNSVLSQEEEEEGRRRTALRGLKGDRGLRVRSVSFLFPKTFCWKSSLGFSKTWTNARTRG